LLIHDSTLNLFLGELQISRQRMNQWKRRMGYFSHDSYATTTELKLFQQ
jgi:hypothetical protein